MNIKNILLVSHELTYTGAPKSLLNIAGILKEEGYHVEIWSLLDGNFKDEFEKAGFYVYIIQGNLMCLREKMNQFCLVIANTIFCAGFADFAQKSIKTVLYIREAQNIPQLLKVANFHKNILNRILNVVCISEYAYEAISANYKPENIAMIHNFVKDFYTGEINVTLDGKIRFLISGTVEYRKGQDIAIAAMNALEEDLKRKCELHIVGRIPDWSKEYWNSLHVDDIPSVIYHGEIRKESEKIKLYKKMNVFIIASRDEACSLVALEGAMLGKCLIMSKNVGAKYLLGTNSMCYECENAEELKNIMALYTSRKKLILEGLAMRKEFLKTSTPEIFRRNFMKVVEELLK